MYLSKKRSPADTDAEALEPLTGGSEQLLHCGRCTRSNKRSNSVDLIVAAITLCFKNLATYSLANGWSRVAATNASDFLYAPPYMEGLDMKVIDYTFDSTIMVENIFRGSPTEAVAEAWNRLAMHGDWGLLIWREQAAAMSNIDHNNVFLKKTVDTPDLPHSGYSVYIEAHHQLHCLNLLPKPLHFNFEYYDNLGEGPFSDPPEMKDTHIRHCFDLLKERLMCTADTGAVPSIWLTKEGDNTIDFQQPHQCSGSWAIERWTEKNKFLLPEGYDNYPPEGVKL